jgi:hypothetical protein
MEDLGKRGYSYRRRQGTLEAVTRASRPEEAPMFTHECSACRRRQLIFPSQFTAARAVEGGLAVTFTCWCGAEETSRMTSLLDEELPLAV